jgi:prepilin peptidase CpaA
MILAAEILVVTSLLCAAAFDVVRREIPDACSIAILLAAALLVAAQPAHWRDGLVAVSAGLVLFLTGAGLFFAGIWGGGDAKLAGAVGAWIGWAGVPSFLLAMALAGGALALLILSLRPARRHVPWLAAERGVPYGVAIAAAGIMVPPAISLGG